MNSLMWKELQLVTISVRVRIGLGSLLIFLVTIGSFYDCICVSLSLSLYFPLSLSLSLSQSLSLPLPLSVSVRNYVCLCQKIQTIGELSSRCCSRRRPALVVTAARVLCVRVCASVYVCVCLCVWLTYVWMHACLYVRVRAYKIVPDLILVQKLPWKHLRPCLFGERWDLNLCFSCVCVCVCVCIFALFVF